MLKVTIKTIYDSLKKYASKIFVAKDITVEFDALTTIVGAGAVVCKTLSGHCTAVGVPARVVKFHE